MKGNYTYLDQLTDKSKNFKVRAKVIQKGRPTQSPSKKRYHRLVLEDEKGNQMRGALFEKDIDSFEEALKRGGEYEISNVTINQVPEQYRTKPEEFQMSFNDKVQIIPLHTERAQLEPKYHSILSIPRNGGPNELIDVLGIVIFVDDIKNIQRTENKETQMLELLITDQSSEHPLLITLWDDLVFAATQDLKSWTDNFLTVGFIAMRLSQRKGFSLYSSMSTTITLNPSTQKAHLLTNWAVDNEGILVQRRSKAIDIRAEKKERKITLLSEIDAKKACNTWQDENFWIEVTIPKASLDDLHPYIGCNKCGRKGDVEKNEEYKFGFCNAHDATAIQRINFSFIATDSSSSYKFIIFNNNVETLFQMKSEDLVSLKNNWETAHAVEKINELQTKKVYLQVAPSTGLSASQILKWNVKSIVFE